MAAYDVNYDDERFTQVENDKQTALSDLEKTYYDMINDSDKYYQNQINASEDWAKEQEKIQNENTDFAIQKIEQQKEQAQKDYIKEQSGAYVDWRKQSNEYGAEAEKMAASGLQRTGYSESAQVSMYNTYQNRVAAARESIRLAIQNYDNGMKEARLQNNAALAEIKYNAMQQQLELSLQSFQYKNQLIETLASKQAEVQQNYYNRYQDVLAQINHENAMAEEIRQYNESLAEQKRQFDEQMAYSKSKSSGGGGGSTTQQTGTITKTGTNSKVEEDKVVKSANTLNGVPVNMQSISDLGYGPRTVEGAEELVAEGKAVRKLVNGVYVYERVTSPYPSNSFLGSMWEKAVK